MAASMKRLWFVLGLIILVVLSTQFSVSHCRVLPVINGHHCFWDWKRARCYCFLFCFFPKLECSSIGKELGL
ncbi:hypothetical protein Patl1_08876 [Pistacia atlantica]|uniref:Uncharacterized protein n=1 Tax=Pistacia atlantica TaxID=434234 RepID=A0ACC1AGJ2_9ROSI|nr:hypothetical protein Patl1_08876 [Pistacia atlantica]